jgi:hypothetical protein
MAAGNFILYDEYKKNQFMTGMDIDSGAVKFALTVSTHSPLVASHTVYDDIDGAEEISHASYTTGGVALTTPAVSEISGPSGDWRFSSDAWELTFTGTDSPTLKYAHMYYDGTVGGVVKPLIGYFQLETGGGGTVTVLAGNKLTLNCPTNGWFRWNGARS